jgi:hypothetical protein
MKLITAPDCNGVFFPCYEIKRKDGSVEYRDQVLEDLRRGLKKFTQELRKAAAEEQ